MLSGQELEIQVAELLDAAGWSVEIEKAEDGLRLDIVATKSGKPKLIVECKAYKQLVGIQTALQFSSVVRHLRQSGQSLDAWLVTTNGFTAKANKALHLDRINAFTIAELKSQLSSTTHGGSKTKEQWAEQARAERAKGKRIFVIMPFSDDMLDVFILGIRWVANELGFVAERADDLEHNGEIIEEVRQAIEQYDVVVADTSGANPNVCYEVGYAHALRKPTILICGTGTELPFDLRGTNHLMYPNIVGLRESLKEKLANALDKT